MGVTSRRGWKAHTRLTKAEEEATGGGGGVCPCADGRDRSRNYNEVRPTGWSSESKAIGGAVRGATSGGRRRAASFPTFTL